MARTKQTFRRTIPSKSISAGGMRYALSPVSSLNVENRPPRGVKRIAAKCPRTSATNPPPPIPSSSAASTPPQPTAAPIPATGLASTLSEEVRVSDGIYKFARVLRTQKIKIKGRWHCVSVLRWKDTIHLNSELKSVDLRKLAKAPYGLNESDKDRIWSSRPNEVAPKDPSKFYCKFCEVPVELRRLMRHETRKCKFPGAPRHICTDICEKDCPGPGLNRRSSSATSTSSHETSSLSNSSSSRSLSDQSGYSSRSNSSGKSSFSSSSNFSRSSGASSTTIIEKVVMPE